MATRALFLIALILLTSVQFASAASHDAAKPLTEDEAKQVIARELELLKPMRNKFAQKNVISTCQSALDRGHDLYSCFMYYYVKNIEQKTRLTFTGHVVVDASALTVLSVQRATFKKPEQLKTTDLEFAEIAVWMGGSTLFKRVRIQDDEQPVKKFVAQLISAVRIGLKAFERDAKNAPATPAETARKQDLERQLKHLEALN